MQMKETTKELLGSVKKCKVYDLGQPYWKTMPVHPADPPFSYFLYRYHEHTKELFKNVAPEFADSIGYVTTSMHAGTHFDLPIHMSRSLKVRGVDITKYERDDGYHDLPEPLFSAESVPPIVVNARLLDVPASKALDILPERYQITADDLQKAMEFADLNIEEGDAILVRTGYSRFFETDSDAYLHKFAGLGPESAKWLAGKKPRLVGIDNLAAGVPIPFEVHNIILTDNGIFLMKSLKLEDLSKDRAYSSLLMVSPLKIKGAEASLVRPIALA